MSIVEVGLANAACALLLALIAVAVGLVCRRPAVVHALWLLVLIKLVTPPLVHIRLPWPTATAPTAQAAVVVEPAEEPPLPAEVFEMEPEEWEEDFLPPEEDMPKLPTDDAALAAPEVGVQPPELAPAVTAPPWRSGLACVWLAGALAWFALAGRRVWQFRRALRHARPAPPELLARIARLAGLLSMNRCPQACLVPGRLPPMVWGTRSPCLLISEQLEAHVGREGLDTLLAHELAHVRRGDQWVRVLEFFALGLYWWNPVVWYARRELREAEEQCCDAWVVRALPGSGRTYATAIVDALDFMAQAGCVVPLLASGLGQVADLKRRLTMILRGSTPHRLGRLAGLAILATATVLLPLFPAPGRGEDVKKDDPAEQKKPVISEFTFRAGQVEVEGELKKLEEQLRAKMADLEVVKKKIAELRSKPPTVEKARGATIRIEISGLNMKPDDLKLLVDKLEKALPGKEKRIVIVQAGSASALMSVPLSRSSGLTRSVPVPVAPRPPVPPGPADKRIDSLEKKVDAILRELDALRKDLKAPRSRDSRTSRGGEGFFLYRGTTEPKQSSPAGR